MNPYLDDPLYRESIPHRISPTPSTVLGPTAQLAIRDALQEWWQLASEQDDAVEEVA